MTDMGNSEQIRLIVEQVGDTLLSKFASEHPELRQNSVVSEIPPPLKWAAIIVSAMVTMAASAGLVWLVTSVSEMSVTLARLDERMAAYTDSQSVRMDQLEDRTKRLEEYHRSGGR